MQACRSDHFNSSVKNHRPRIRRPTFKILKYLKKNEAIFANILPLTKLMKIVSIFNLIYQHDNFSALRQRKRDNGLHYDMQKDDTFLALGFKIELPHHLLVQYILWQGKKQHIYCPYSKACPR